MILIHPPKQNKTRNKVFYYNCDKNNEAGKGLEESTVSKQKLKALHFLTQVSKNFAD